MDLCQVESFVVLSEELHFGRAAERMGCSQPAFSQKIKRLEEYVGFDVVDRSNRQVKLTPGGAAFLPDARKLLSDVDAMISSASRVATGNAGVLRVGYVEAALFVVIPSITAALRETNPDVEVVLVPAESKDQLQALLDDTLDIGLIKGSAVEAPGVEVSPVLSESLAVAMSASNPLADDAEVRLQDLATQRFVLFPREKEPELYDQLINMCGEHGFAPNVVQTASGFQALLSLAAADVGVTFVTESMSKNTTRDGVVFRPLADPKPKMVLSFIRSSKSKNPLVLSVEQICDGLDTKLETDRAI